MLAKAIMPTCQEGTWPQRINQSGGVRLTGERSHRARTPDPEVLSHGLAKNRMII